MLKKILNKPLFKELIVLSLALYILNELAWDHHLYYQDIGGEFDSLMHFLGGLTTSVGVLWLYFFSGVFGPRNRKYLYFFVISILGIMFVGFAWEIYEILAGTMIVNGFDYIFDTSLDIFFDTLGAVVGCIYAFRRERIESLKMLPE